jgi:class 3 adenylate cyclase
VSEAAKEHVQRRGPDAAPSARRRLEWLDWALLGTLGSLFLVCFGLHVHAVLTDTLLYHAHYVSPPQTPTDAPTVEGFILEFENPGDLQVGDRILSIDGIDTRGASAFEVSALTHGQARGGMVPMEIERDGVRQPITLSTVQPEVPWYRIPLVLGFAIVAVIVLLLSPGSGPARLMFVAFISVAIFQSFFTGTSTLQLYAGIFTFHVWGVIAIFTVGLWISQFPTGLDSRHRIRRGWAILPAILWILPRTTQYLGGPLPLGSVSIQMFVADIVLFAWLLGVLSWNYRHAGLVGRRQIKWVVLGAYLGFLPYISMAALVALNPDLAGLRTAHAWGVGLVALVPAGFLVAIAGFNLFDVDRLLSAAASYNVVIVLLGATALVLVPRAAEAGSGVVGIDPEAGQVVLSLLLAGAVIPAHRRLRPQIDRLFFKERYALDHGIADLLPTLSTCKDARELTERAGQGLFRLLRPEGCVVYALVQESYVPVFVEGHAVPPTFGAASPLVGTLAERRRPLALGDTGRRPDEAPLGPFDRAALETLGVEVVVPVRRDEDLAAFICLGPKRSGDVYTSTDVSQLAALAETVSLQLQRFDQDEVIREAHEMQESLRRYVPGAIAEQLSAGTELSSGERAITVLFVDIRGYTSFSESRQAGEIFSTINRYTETVSEIVGKHGGSVVEFNGDGMMTVFGAPRELSHKERAAVEAGREIVAAVGSMQVEDPQGGRTKLSVGVGIATGEAFVGNIQAVDRMIWSAIGNTTNLAARLQSMTRELEVSLVIDAGTWERAQATAGDFEKRPGVPIRGRRYRQDLYVLAMPEPS